MKTDDVYRQRARGDLCGRRRARRGRGCGLPLSRPGRRRLGRGRLLRARRRHIHPGARRDGRRGCRDPRRAPGGGRRGPRRSGSRRRGPGGRLDDPGAATRGGRARGSGQLGAPARRRRGARGGGNARYHAGCGRYHLRYCVARPDGLDGSAGGLGSDLPDQRECKRPGREPRGQRPRHAAECGGSRLDRGRPVGDVVHCSRHRSSDQRGPFPKGGAERRGRPGSGGSIALRCQPSIAGHRRHGSVELGMGLRLCPIVLWNIAEWIQRWIHAEKLDMDLELRRESGSVSGSNYRSVSARQRECLHSRRKRPGTTGP